MLKNSVKKYISIFISACLFICTIVAVEYWVGWYAIISSILAIHPLTILLLSALTLISYLLRALRIRVGFIETKQHSFSVLFNLSATHTLLNNLLPMRAGEIAFPLLMKQKYQVKLVDSASKLFLYRALDLLVLIGLGVSVFLQSIHFWLFILFIPCCLICLLLIHSLKMFLIHLLPTSWSRVTKTLISLPTSGTTYYHILILTLLLWLAKISAFVGLVMAASELNFQQAAISSIVADLSSVLPIHGIAGTGTFEGAFVLSGKVFSINTAVLLATATQLHLFLLFMSLFIWAGSTLFVSALKPQPPLK